MRSDHEFSLGLSASAPPAPKHFDVPESLFAKEPPEVRQGRRDAVRLMVLDRQSGAVRHRNFTDLVQILSPKDLLVFNRSRTLPASVDATTGGGEKITVRLAERLDSGEWMALVLPSAAVYPGSQLYFGDSLHAQVVEADSRIPGLWRLDFGAAPGSVLAQLYKFGQPIRYEYVASDWPLSSYQTVYASEPGSAEMPSAGRAFTWEMLFKLKKAGVQTTSIVLHTGLSSYMDDEVDAAHLASEEPYRIDESAADLINRTKLAGRKIIAVGTTVVRALETVADEYGRIRSGSGYTRLRVTPEHRLKCVDGIITGLHEPEASHLDLLSAFIHPQLLYAAYREAVDRGYLWHEFGDINLIV